MSLQINNRSSFSYYKKFLNYSIDKQYSELVNRPPEFWEKMGKEKAIDTAKAASNSIPAYKDFLISANITNSITAETFNTLPLMSKDNYLTKYPLKNVNWGGSLNNQNVISVSSGSTGNPFFWPRDALLEKEVDSAYELLLSKVFEIDKYSTLLIIGYSMGMYVAGPFTFSSILRVAQKGYPLTIVTPGIEIKDIIRVVSHLAAQFDQIIIAGYPPFVKDVLDAGDRASIPWKQYKVRYIFGAESFTEKWRNHVLSRTRTGDDLSATSNTYGSADSAILGMESELSIFIRREASENKELRQLLFRNERLPALFQFNPLFKYFEQIENNSLIFTSSAGLPLIRYKIGDTGGVIKYNDAIKMLRALGISIPARLIKHSYKLPFVYLYDRADFTVHLYGVNIYIENVKAALDLSPLANHFTGKFMMTTTTKRNFDQVLTIYLELNQDTKASSSLKKLAEKYICEVLKEKNSEFCRLHDGVGRKASPKVKLIEHGNKKYFSVGVKQKWKT